MVNWLRLFAQTMFPNLGLSQGLGPALAPTQDEYQSHGYNPQPRSLFPVSSSNPFLNNRMMVMMMLEKFRATKVSLNQLNASKLFPVDACWTSSFVAVSWPFFRGRSFVAVSETIRPVSSKLGWFTP